MYNLGLAIAEQRKVDPSIREESAAAALNRVLEVFTIDAMPGDFRNTRRNLGGLFFNGRRWEEALFSYQACLQAGKRLYESGARARQARLVENRDASARTVYCLARLGRRREVVLGPGSSFPIIYFSPFGIFCSATWICPLLDLWFFPGAAPAFSIFRTSSTGSWGSRSAFCRPGLRALSEPYGRPQMFQRSCS